ncbi:MAG TPA: hypothetical protein VFH33_05595 [Candidatus Krumholzibacteria bacterium]|nr:hypothetical protein [Candidatus Krumholzibacteria bacterium]
MLARERTTRSLPKSRALSVSRTSARTASASASSKRTDASRRSRRGRKAPASPSLSFAIVLPARYASSRFPGKPLAVISGRPLIEWVHRAALLKLAKLPRTALEVSERLEQLRALEHGMTIAVVETEHETVGVDVPSDVKKVEKFLQHSLD